jgi:hypothetical protein
MPENICALWSHGPVRPTWENHQVVTPLSKLSASPNPPTSE